MHEMNIIIYKKKSLIFDKWVNYLIIYKQTIRPNWQSFMVMCVNAMYTTNFVGNLFHNIWDGRF